MISTRGEADSAGASSASNQHLQHVQTRGQSSSLEMRGSITPAKKPAQTAASPFARLADAVPQLAENQVPAARVFHQAAVEATLELPQAVPGMGPVGAGRYAPEVVVAAAFANGCLDGGPFGGVDRLELPVASGGPGEHVVAAPVMVDHQHGGHRLPLDARDVGPGP